MLHRRDRATGTSNRDTDATSRDLDGVRGPDGDDGDEHVGAAAEVEPEVYDDGDWDEDEDDAAADWEEGEEQGDWDNTDEDDEEFVPPTAGTALRRSWLSARSRAQPATGTEEDGRKVVVWGHHHEVLGALAEGLKDHNPVVYSGLTKPGDRQLAVSRFQNDTAVKVFIGSIQAAGVGITLTASSHVVFAESDWTPSAMSQAEDRCHRIGQQDSVLVQVPEVEGSIDSMMSSRLREKTNVIDSVIDGERMAS